MPNPWSNQLVSLLIVSATGGFAGVFLYAPSPGAGNLVASVTAAAGTDPFGNPYVEGVSSYVKRAGVTFALQLGSEIIGGVTAPAFFIHNVTAPPFSDPGYSATAASTAGCGAEIYSGQATAGSNPAVIAVEDSTESGIAGGLVQLICGQTILNSSAAQAIPVAAPAGFPLPADPNSGTGWVTGERAFMNNNWITPINNLFTALVNAGIIV